MPLQRFITIHMSSFAKVVRSTIALLRFSVAGLDE
jgi:hypothetical protein